MPFKLFYQLFNYQMVIITETAMKHYRIFFCFFYRRIQMVYAASLYAILQWQWSRALRYFSSLSNSSWPQAACLFIYYVNDFFSLLSHVCIFSSRDSVSARIFIDLCSWSNLKFCCAPEAFLRYNNNDSYTHSHVIKICFLFWLNGDNSDNNTHYYPLT